MNKNKIYYLASPYSHKDPLVETLRYEAVSYIASKLILEGYTVIEPIGSCFDKSLKYDMPGGYEYWQKRDRKYISLCDGIIIVTMKGWEESIGVSDEISYARNKNKEIIFLNPENYISEEALNALHNSAE